MKILLCIMVAFIAFASCSEAKSNSVTISDEITIPKEITKPSLDLEKLKQKANEGLEFSKKNKLNTDFCILVDMSLHSGTKRFFVWDFKKNTIVHQYLVGHGCGTNSWSRDETKDQPTFSNEDGSHLSSLGKYKLGIRGNSEWGVRIKYIMHGLEDTNSNALSRFIVFHSWELMSDEEIFPAGSPEGWGCPTISNNAFLELDPLLKNSKKSVLFWIFQ